MNATPALALACSLLLGCGGSSTDTTGDATADTLDTHAIDASAQADTSPTPDDTGPPVDTREPPPAPGPAPGTTLIISEYVEGEGDNKALELFNPSLRTIDLQEYELWIASNGAAWPGEVVKLYGDALAPGETRVVVEKDAEQALLDLTDDLGQVAGLTFDGDDAVGLVWAPPWEEARLVDAVGTAGADPGEGFSVAGVAAGTKDHTLRRRTGVLVGDPTWVAGAGTRAEDSEWEVLPLGTHDDLGVPQVCDGLEAFTCSGVGAECGAIRPPCGGVLDCGGCDGDVVCGNNVCGGPFRMLVDAQRGEDGSAPEHFAVRYGVAYLAADDTEVGRELWRSDGTAEGTYVVRDIYAHTSKGADPHELVAMGGAVYFAATRDGCVGLWMTSGTSSSTQPLTNDCIDPESLVVAGDHLFFRARDDYGGTILWVTNGTWTGTKAVLTGDGYEVPSPTGLTAWDDTVLFGLSDSSGVQQLWQSDGTSAGTRRIKDFDTYDQDQVGIFEMVRLGDRALLGAWWPEHGRELVASDLTSAGTTMVADLTPGFSYASVPASTDPDAFCVHDGFAYFRGSNSDFSGLFRTDGTAGGSARVDLGDSDRPADLVSVGARLFFTSDGGARLQVIEGAAAPIALDVPTGAIVQLTAAGDALYFRSGSQLAPKILWRSDGTPQGTAPVAEAALGGMGVTRILGYDDGKLFVVADDGVHGEEPWVLLVAP